MKARLGLHKLGIPHPMTDVILVSSLLGFAGLCIAYVSWCDRVVGTVAVVESSPPGDSTTSHDSVSSQS